MLHISTHATRLPRSQLTLLRYASSASPSEVCLSGITRLSRPRKLILRIQSSPKPAASLPTKPATLYSNVTHPVPNPSPAARTQHLLELADKYVLPVYARPPIVLEKGKGSWVWDLEGRKYLDFAAGIAVNALGHADDGVAEVRSSSWPARFPLSRGHRKQTGTEAFIFT